MAHCPPKPPEKKNFSGGFGSNLAFFLFACYKFFIIIFMTFLFTGILAASGKKP